MAWLNDELSEHQRVFQAFQQEAEIFVPLVVARALKVLHQGGTLFMAGNGGSASQASHLAGEVVGRFRVDRPAWKAIALNTDTTIITAVANDYGYEEIFARQIEGLAQAGDDLWLFSTSGQSPNLIRAAEVAKEKGVSLTGFLGRDGGALKDMCDPALVVPAQASDRIQEIHIMAGHLICQGIEAQLTAK